MADAWMPPLSPKQMKFLQLCHRYPENLKKYILNAGPRQAIKTTCCLHAIVDHLWNVNNARFAVVSPTVTSGDDNGCWTAITEKMIPDWIAGDFGMEWVTEPRQKGTTKKLYCEIKNKFGTISRAHLDSLAHEEDVEGRFKNKEYSGIYVAELSNYKRRSTFDCWRECLRGSQWKDWEFVFIGDSNPADEGEDSWIWQLWFQQRVADYGDDEGMKIFQNELALMEFFVSDNIFKDAKWHLAQKAKYAHSQDLLDRYYYGKWVKASGNAIFHEQFRPNVHVLGDVETRSNPEPDTILPEDNCHELKTGWDTGHVNYAFVIAEKIFVPRHDGKEVSVFKFLDEAVCIGRTDITLGDFVEECMEKILFWEEYIGNPIMWRNWSDKNVFDFRESMSTIMPHEYIRQESITPDCPQGKIVLTAVQKGPGSVQQRVDLLKKLLFENRIYISRSKCPNLIESLSGLRKGKGNVAVDKQSKLKHCYDAASYLIGSECVDEIIRPRDDMNVGSVKRDDYVAVPL